jgi:hypothetical protein
MGLKMVELWLEHPTEVLTNPTAGILGCLHASIFLVSQKLSIFCFSGC